jgi:probable HAF family extracellular repeat protein
MYHILDLGTFGGTDTRASGINAKGDVVGHGASTSSTIGCYLRTFRYTDDAGLVDLGVEAGFQSCSYGTGINDAGQIAFNLDHHPGSGDYTARIYIPGQGATDLAALSGDIGSYTTSIGRSGEVVGGTVGDVAGLLGSAFLYTRAAGMQDLGNLGGGRAQANGMNSQGIVVGWARTPDTPLGDIWNVGNAFAYFDGEGLVDLNGLATGQGWNLWTANAINDGGQIVGWGRHSDVIHAFRFDLATGSIEDLGTFPGGGISYARATNATGWVVGAAYLDASGAGNFRAAAWQPGVPGAQNLNALIPAGAGWILLEATGINDAGQIVGWGQVSGETRAFRLTPV